MTNLSIKSLSIAKSTLVIFLALALTATSFFSSWMVANATENEGNNNSNNTVTVSIQKYIDGEMATAYSADNTDFQMESAWDAENIGAGAGTYSLNEDGYNSDTAYEAITSEMTKGADYTTNEIMDENVGASCDTDHPYALTGYSYGNSWGQAKNASVSMTPPAFEDIKQNKYVIVWNEDCETPSEPAPQDEVTVTIVKYVEGEMATAESADDMDFQMSATWDADNTGAGTGQYSLSEDNETPYKAKTANMTSGADYSTHEMMDENVGASCDTDHPYALKGYTYGNSLADAADNTPTSTPPSFTNLTYDKYVIVWNYDCSVDHDNDGELEGEVGGATGELEVTSIEVIDGTGTANGNFESGWEYVFNITVPTDEEDLSMKFANWMRNGGGGTIPAANNMRISSEQASNDGATVLITAADTYSNPKLHITEDLDPTMDGMQVEVTVEVAIPTGTPNGTYTTTYGVKSE